jgi:K+/H+ antiporter YhaU regulatory subunit KhtT
MRKVKVHHERLAGVGERFQLTTASGLNVTVVCHRSGRRDLAMGAPGADAPIVIAALSRTEAAAVAALLTGTHIELQTVRA